VMCRCDDGVGTRSLVSTGNFLQQYTVAKFVRFHKKLLAHEVHSRYNVRRGCRADSCTLLFVQKTSKPDTSHD
jgi:hypothetical protein